MLEANKPKLFNVICHVCGKTWKHEAYDYDMIEPCDIQGRIIVNCNIAVIPYVHNERQIRTSWKQIYTRVKELGEKNKYEYI